MNDVKIVFFDIDGTLLPHRPDSLIPPSALKALNDAKQNGILLYICTGRPYPVLPFERLKGVSFDGFICYNGGLILENGKPVKENYIDEKDLPIILENAKKHHIGIAVANKEKMLSFYSSDSLLKYVQKADPSNLSIDEIHPLQICAGLNYKKAPLLLEGCKNTDFTYWCDYGIDIIPAHTSKANALKAVCELHHIPISSSMAIGDGVNDISMLEKAGIGIAMGNSQPEVFKYADYITDDIENDGIKNAFVHFGLIS